MIPEFVRIGESLSALPHQVSASTRELLGKDIEFQGLEDLFKQLLERGVAPDMMVNYLGGLEGLKELIGEQQLDELLSQLDKSGMSPTQIVTALGGVEGLKTLMGCRPTDRTRFAASFIVAEAGYGDPCSAD